MSTTVYTQRKNTAAKYHKMTVNIFEYYYFEINFQPQATAKYHYTQITAVPLNDVNKI